MDPGLLKVKTLNRLLRNELNAAPWTRRRILLLMVLVTGLATTCARRSGSGASNRNAAPSRGMSTGDLVADKTGAGAGTSARLTPDAGRAPPLKVLSAALTTVDEKYVAPERINPAKMFDKALEFVEAEIDTGPACREDGDCPGGHLCRAGVCSQICLDDSDCGEDEACTGGICTALGGGGSSGGCAAVGGRSSLVLALWWLPLLVLLRRR